MTVLDDVRNLIARLCRTPFAERLRLTVRQHAKHKTREHAGADGFGRGKGPWSLCNGDKLVRRR